MRHRRTTPKLSRTPSHRKAMLRTMVTDLLRHGHVQTTQAKAKAVRPLAERMITLGKRETLNARRHAARVIRDKTVVKKLFDELAPRYAERPGGYTRIIKLPHRSGDGADMALIELVEAELDRKPSKPKKKKRGGPRTAAQDTAAAAAAASEAEGESSADEVAAAGAPDGELEESQKAEVDAAPDEAAEVGREEAHETEGEPIKDVEVDDEDR